MAVRRKIQRIGGGYKPPESSQFTRVVQSRSAVTVTDKSRRRISRGQPLENASSSPQKQVEPSEISVPEQKFSLRRVERSSLVVGPPGSLLSSRAPGQIHDAVDAHLARHLA
jgi:hypothetical protein